MTHISVVGYIYHNAYIIQETNRFEISRIYWGNGSLLQQLVSLDQMTVIMTIRAWKGSHEEVSCGEVISGGPLLSNNSTTDDN